MSDVVSFLLTHGGRTYNQTARPPSRWKGSCCPQAKPTNDAAGQFFVDNLHMDFNNTSRIPRPVQANLELIHEGDLFGIVSTGPSSIAIDLTYDRKRLDEAIGTAGNGLKPKEIIDAPLGADGPPEIKYRAHVAFSTAYNLLKTLEQVHNRRKSFILVSNGYDFNPFPNSA